LVLFAEVKVGFDHFRDTGLVFEFLDLFSEFCRHGGNFGIDVSSLNVFMVLIVLFEEISVIPILPVGVLSELLCDFLFVLLGNWVRALITNKRYLCAYFSFLGNGVRGPYTF
jgi:hypothetical protein